MSIEQKRKDLPWVWIFTGLAIMFFAIYFFKLGPFKKTETLSLRAPEVRLLQKHENDSTVNDYINFIQHDPMKMGVDHEFSYTALIKLSAATEAMAKTIGYRLPYDLSVVTGYAEKITKNPTAFSHAEYIKKSADILAKALIGMQQKEYPSLAKDGNVLKYSAVDIDSEILTLDQRKKVKIFFIRAANLLKKMN